MKKNIHELAIFGASPAFSPPISTSSLAKPDLESFLRYSETIFSELQYTNNGPLNQTLEKRLAEFHDSEYCVTACSGFWALVVAIKAMKIPNRTEIVMPSLTYRRMADVAAWSGLIPRFCDVDPATLSPSKDDIKECINSNTAIILGVHPIVNTCDTQALTQLSSESRIPLLIDSVESAYESTSCGRVGSVATAEVFSMHASKLLNAGEGGYITTNNKELAHKLSILRAFGFEGQDTISIEGGMNAKLNEVHAAMALANLDELDRLIEHNREIYNLYETELKKLSGLSLVRFDDTYPTSYKNILVELEDDWPLTRSETLEILEKEGILARAYYGEPLHRKKMSYEHIKSTLPKTEELAEKFMLFPCGYKVDKEDIREFIDILSYIKNQASLIRSTMAARNSNENT